MKSKPASSPIFARLTAALISINIKLKVAAGRLIYFFPVYYNSAEEQERARQDRAAREKKGEKLPYCIDQTRLFSHSKLTLLQFYLASHFIECIDISFKVIR